jgi:vitamin B12 transporter
VADRHENRRVEAEAGWKLAAAGRSLELKTQAARDLLDSSTDGNVSRDRAALAVLGERSWRRWSVALALRGDLLEHFDPRAMVRVSGSRTLAGIVDAGSWLALRAGAGTGFRPPTFDDLFWPARASAAGNPDLVPERSLDTDLGLEMRLGGGTRLQFTGFHNRVRDLIQWTPGADGVWRPHNVGEARIRGLELEGSTLLTAAPIRLDAALTWLDAVDATGDPVTGGRQLVGRSRWTGYGEISLERGAWTFGVGARGVDRVPLTAANSKWVDGYMLFHSRVRWRIQPALHLDLEGRNLADTPYEDLRGYPTPGREVLAGIRFTPGAGS